MNFRSFCLILSLCWGVGACSWFKNSQSPEAVKQVELPASRGGVQKVLPGPTASSSPQKDRTLEYFAKIFEQSDAIHREAWWVLANERRPNGKSPFGKVQRAILSSENVKLPNKSAFRCDRYIMKRDVLGAGGYPQRLEIFEKCEERLPAKQLALVSISSKNEFDVVFNPENLEEILGLGPAILNRKIRCVLKANESEQLENLKCTDWAQNRTQEQMIQLDEYEYARAGKNLIKLRGKVYENLTDTRKIVADVPLEGKILVTETELYPPEPTPTPKPSIVMKPTPAKGPMPAPKASPLSEEEAAARQGWPTQEGVPPGPGSVTPLVFGEDGTLLPPQNPQADPDVMMMQQQQQQYQQQYPDQPTNPPQEHPEGGYIIEGGEVVVPGLGIPQSSPQQNQVPPAGEAHGR